MLSFRPTKHVVPEHVRVRAVKRVVLASTRRIVGGIPVISFCEASRTIYSIWAIDQHQRVIGYRDLLATEPSPATLSFAIPEGVTSIRAFEHCNAHGLFQSDIVVVTANQTVPGSQSQIWALVTSEMCVLFVDRL